MQSFLSEEEILRHKEYLKNLNLKFSILEKSIRGAENQAEVIRALSGEERRKAEELFSRIKLHELFFSSFSDNTTLKNERIARQYGSEASFLYALYKLGLKSRHGFLSVLKKGERIFPVLSEDYFYLSGLGKPVLAIDLYEHAYYRDYGFDKEKYLEGALRHLDLAKL